MIFHPCKICFEIGPTSSSRGLSLGELNQAILRHFPLTSSWGKYGRIYHSNSPIQ